MDKDSLSRDVAFSPRLGRNPSNCSEKCLYPSPTPGRYAKPTPTEWIFAEPPRTASTSHTPIQNAEVFSKAWSFLNPCQHTFGST